MKILMFCIFLTKASLASTIIDPKIESFVHKGIKKSLLHNKANINWSNLLYASCRSIDLRISRNLELDNQYEQVSSMEATTLQENLALRDIKAFLMGQINSTYEVALFKNLHDLQIPVNDLNLDKEEFKFSIYGGDISLSFRSEDSFINYNEDFLEQKISNYQYCLDKTYNLYVVKDCYARSWNELETCSENEVHLYQYSIPSRIMGTGNLWRER